MRQDFKKRMTEIVQTSFKLLEKKVQYGGVVFKNEASLQLELGYILKVVGQLYQFNSSEKFHLEMENSICLRNTIIGKSKKARIDIYMEIGNNIGKIKCAIELKYFKKANLREPNNRYDVFKDFLKLESYRIYGVDLCYFYIMTDHQHYVNHPRYSSDTCDFDFRHNTKYIAGTVLVYRTATPQGKPIKLKGDYNFKWNTLTQDLFTMKLKIK
jgi:hypothetical protein